MRARKFISLCVGVAAAWSLAAHAQESETLGTTLKIAKPIKFKENIALVLKYFDKLSPLMTQEHP